MREIDYSKDFERLLTPRIADKLLKIHELKGADSILLEAYEDNLVELKEVAKTKSVEASNIIGRIPDNSLVHGGFMLVASPNESEFLNSSMSSQWYIKFINIYVSGGNGAIGNLSKSDLDNR